MISAEWDRDMVAMNCIISMRKLARERKDLLCFGFKDCILAQDENEAK